MLDAAIAQIPARHRRDLLITVDGATLDLIGHITTRNTAHGRRVHYSVGLTGLLRTSHPACDTTPCPATSTSRSFDHPVTSP